MTTPPRKPDKTPDKSADPGSGFETKAGELPNDAFENDPGAPKDIGKFMSKEALADFDAETQRLKVEVGRKP